jgi:hypothetical protein
VAGGADEASQRPHVGGQTLILPSGERELREAVDDNALDIAAGELATDESAGLIEVDLYRGRAVREPARGAACAAPGAVSPAPNMAPSSFRDSSRSFRKTLVRGLRQ